MFAASEVTNLTQSWGTSPVPINEIIRRSLTQLRARSREQIRNNSYARKFMGMLKTNVVGPTGFNFNAKSRDPNGQLDKLANQSLERVFKQWCKRKNCDLYGKQSFWDMVRTMISAGVAGDGESLHQIHIGSQYGKYGVQIEALDPELLYTHHNEDLRDGNTIRMGIEYDKRGRAVAYHLRESKGIDPMLGLNTYVSGQYIRVPANRIIHCYVVDNPGQIRGFPWMAPALINLNHQGGFVEAALVNARAGAGKMGFYTDLDDLSEVADKDPESGEFVDESDPGTFHRLPPGVQVQTYDPTYPNNEFESFMKTTLRSIAAGLGVSYHTLANDLEGVNYSSGRLGVFDERDVWKTLQNWVAECFLEPVYEAWLEHQLLRGTVTVNGNPLRGSAFEKYSEVEFSGRRWHGIDPAKESKANTEELGQKTTSRTQIIREKGREPEDVFNEISEEEKLMKELGLQVAPPAAPAPDKKPNDDERPDEDDDE